MDLPRAISKLLSSGVTVIETIEESDGHSLSPVSESSMMALHNEGSIPAIKIFFLIVTKELYYGVDNISIVVLVYWKFDNYSIANWA